MGTVSYLRCFSPSSQQEMVCFIMHVPRSRLGLEGDETVAVLDLKCSPLMVGSLMSEQGFLPAYHMNKSSWISILLDGSVPDEKIIPLLELSYDSAAPKRKKR